MLSDDTRQVEDLVRRVIAQTMQTIEKTPGISAEDRPDVLNLVGFAMAGFALADPNFPEILEDAAKEKKLLYMAVSGMLLGWGIQQMALLHVGGARPSDEEVMALVERIENAARKILKILPDAGGREDFL